MMIGVTKLYNGLYMLTYHLKTTNTSKMSFPDTPDPNPLLLTSLIYC